MSFRYSWILLFLLFQFLLWVFWRLKIKQSDGLFPNASEKMLQMIKLNIDENRVRLRNQFIFLGLTFLTLAASGPQIGTRIRPVERKGVDLVIALDTSTSMDAEDVKPSRLAKAKFELGQLIRKLKGDRVAIIVFAGTSHLYLPLTTDYEAAMLFLNEIDTDMIPTQGTAMSAAIKTAMSAFMEEKDKFKVMLLVTDGEDHEGETVELAEQAARTGLQINTVGVGSAKGSLIPVKNRKNKAQEYKRDKKGKLVTSIVNEVILKDVAAAGNGTYFWFSNTRDTHLDIIESIENMEKKTISTHEFSEYEDRYQAVGLLSLGFLVIGFIWPTKPKRKPL